MAYNVTDREMRRILSLPPVEIFAAALRIGGEALEDDALSQHEGKRFFEADVTGGCCSDCENPDCEGSEVDALDFDRCGYEGWIQEVSAQAVAVSVVMRNEAWRAA